MFKFMFFLIFYIHLHVSYISYYEVGLSWYSRWNKLIQKPFEDGDERGLKLVQSILKPIMLRRTKYSTDREGRWVISFYIYIVFCPKTHCMYAGLFSFFLQLIFRLYIVNSPKPKKTSMRLCLKDLRYLLIVVINCHYPVLVLLKWTHWSSGLAMVLPPTFLFDWPLKNRYCILALLLFFVFAYLLLVEL